MSSVSSSPGMESKPVWRIPELVPLAASPGSGSASSSATETPRRASASAAAQPTTPAPTTAISASMPRIQAESEKSVDRGPPGAVSSRHQ